MSRLAEVLIESGRKRRTVTGWVTNMSGGMLALVRYARAMEEGRVCVYVAPKRRKYGRREGQQW